MSDAIYDESKPFSEIKIIAIDDKSIKEIGRWPWSRSVFENAFEKLENAFVIGVDVSFLEPENNQTDYSLQLKLDSLKGKIILVSECSEFSNDKKSEISATQRNEIPGVLEARLQSMPKTFQVFQHNECVKWLYPIFDVETASANVFDDGGITRAVPATIDGVPSFSKLISEKYLKTNLEMDEVNHAGEPNVSSITETQDVSYYIRFSRFDKISFSDFMNSTEDFDGKIVLIGATANNLHDFRETPIGTLSGVEVHASAIQTIITNTFLEKQSRTSVILWIFALSIIVSLFLWQFKLPLATVLSVLLIIIYPTIAILKFNSGIVYNLLYPILAIILTYFLVIGLYYLIESRQRKWISNVLGKYVSDSVAKEIMEKGEAALKMKGSKKIVTVLFADIRGFTSMSEKLQPEQVVEVLNKYLSKMTDLVFKHGGTLDKYVGDEIMATYNVPLDLEDHAIKAVQTAIDMQKTARAMGPELKYGIGINTGEAIVGNIGSEKRLDYTVIGDSVNIGARLCSKAEPNQILVSESTNNLVKEFIKTKSIGEITVKGKEKPLKVYEIIY